jgi:hypothetical protein
MNPLRIAERVRALRKRPKPIASAPAPWLWQNKRSLSSPVSEKTFRFSWRLTRRSLDLEWWEAAGLAWLVLAAGIVGFWVGLCVDIPLEAGLMRWLAAALGAAYGARLCRELVRQR